MPDWSASIANEFIALAGQGGALTQMQLQKLVYIAHGWNLAINGDKLTLDDPEAWDYGPVYRSLRGALRDYGRNPITRRIKYGEFAPGFFAEEPDGYATAALTEKEKAVVQRVFRDYGKFHAFQLSALTHKENTPWSTVYNGGSGRYDDIPAGLIKDHFVGLARARSAKT